MKIIICGAGRTGWSIAHHLSLEGNEVTVIDMDANLVSRAINMLDVSGVHGFASYPQTLEKANAKSADMIIAVTNSDEINMIVCQVAHSLFDIRTKIARLRSDSYIDRNYSELFRRDHIPIDIIIRSEKEIANVAIRRLYSPATFERGEMLGGEVQILGIRLDQDCPMLNTRIRQLSELFGSLCAFVVAIRRDSILRATDSDDLLFEGDQIYIVVKTEHEKRTLELFGKVQKKPKNLVIIGGGKVGLMIARTVESQNDNLSIKIIERSKLRAETVADNISRTIILHGDGLSGDLLAETISKKDCTAICVTENDQTNLLLGARAKVHGCEHVISVINDPSLLSLLKEMQIDSFINPNASTSSIILKNIRAGQIGSVYSIGSAEAEIIEIEVLLSSKISGSKISEINLPESVRIGLIKKRKKIIRPDKNTRIEAGDKLVLFNLSKDWAEMQTLLQATAHIF